MSHHLHPLYVDQVGRQVKAKELRLEVKEEISVHLYELWESFRSDDVDDDTRHSWLLPKWEPQKKLPQDLTKFTSRESLGEC
jgi:hypothetical protein